MQRLAVLTKRPRRIAMPLLGKSMRPPRILVLIIDLADLLLDLSKPGEALPFLLQAADIAPRNFKPHELLGKAYIRLERPRETQLELEKAIELALDVANFHGMLVTAYRKQSLMDKAKIEVDRCAAKITTLVDTHPSFR